MWKKYKKPNQTRKKQNKNHRNLPKKKEYTHVMKETPDPSSYPSSCAAAKNIPVTVNQLDAEIIILDNLWLMKNIEIIHQSKKDFNIWLSRSIVVV